jgi:hypothetical protein
MEGSINCVTSKSKETGGEKYLEGETPKKKKFFFFFLETVSLCETQTSATAFQMLELQACTTMPSELFASNWVPVI